MSLRYGSVCTGIKAEGVAWAPLGWTHVFSAEIDPRPCAVLNHHWQEVPNLGDFTKIKETPSPIDLLMGGTPCQDFSVAGLRAGLAGDRGNLTLEFLRLAGRLRPDWLVWENVPGVLSIDGGRAFGAFLGGLAQLGYGFAYRVLDAQYVRVDGYARAVPQRRRRVFVVGRTGGDWQSAAAVLFERESLSGHPAPCRRAGAGIAASLTSSLGHRGGVPDGADTEGQLIAYQCHGSNVGPMGTLRAGNGNETGGVPFIAYQDSGGSSWREGIGPLTSSDDNGTNQVVVIPFDTNQITSRLNRSHPRPGDPSHHLVSFGEPPTIAFQERGRDGGRSLEWQENVAYSLNAISGGSRTNENNIAYLESAVAHALKAEGGDASEDGTGRGVPLVPCGWSVRRLMPVECERLQGFPDGYTAVPYRGKTMADGPRYFVLGNSIAINVLRWIGLRIEMVRQVPGGGR